MVNPQASPPSSTPTAGNEICEMGTHNPIFTDDTDGLEFQIAMDALAAGNSDPLRIHLARIEGLDPSTVAIRSSPFEVNEQTGSSHFTYIGEMDNVNEPDHEGPINTVQDDRQEGRPQVILCSPEEDFTYSPLNEEKREIRLLRLAPEIDKGLVATLEIQTFSLDDMPAYYALSYVWGQPDKIMPLPINGKRIMVTQNLFHALHIVIQRYEGVWLWADGICINQEDLHERGMQVGLMGDIYEGARMVVACTGHHRYEMTGGDASDVDEEFVCVDPLQSKSPTFKTGEKKLVDDDAPSTVTEARPMGDELIEVPEPGVSQSAISLMNYLSRIWASDEDYALKDDDEWKKQKIPDGSSEENARIWLRLFSILREDWFYRSWVTQEAVLGKKVVLLIDDTAISLDFIMKFWERARKRDMPEVLKHGRLADEYAAIMHLNPVSSMNLLRDATHPRPQSVPIQKSNSGDEDQVEDGSPKALDSGSMPDMEAKSNLPTNFLELLSLFRSNLASDPRDKVYSFLGLAKQDPVASIIKPDYSPTNTPATLYRSVAAAFIHSGQGPALLQFAGLDRPTPNLPSWAPDWTRQSRSSMDASLYNCCGSSIPRMRISPEDPNKLFIRGAVIDTIRWNSIPWLYYSHDRSQPNFGIMKEAPDQEWPSFTGEDSLCLIRTMAIQGGTEYCSRFDVDEGLEMAIGRTLCMDRTWRGSRTSSDSSFKGGFEAFQKLYGEGPGEELPKDKKVHWLGIFAWVWDFDEVEEKRLRKLSWLFEVAMAEGHRGRRFCATKEGYMCCAPYNTERGDEVVVFEGFKAPFIVRRDEEGCRIVGECYVHGIMDGELVVSAPSESGSEEVFGETDGRKFSVRTRSGLAKFEELCFV